MKQYLLSFAALALMFACSPENNPGGTGNNGKDPGGNKEVVATAIKLSTNDLNLHKGETATITATVAPSNATDAIVWETSDESVATVADGLISAIGYGEATITAKAGFQKAECKVTVIAIPDYAVDLGIVMTREDGTTYTLYWAEANLSASGFCANPEDYGKYFAWGEIEPKGSYNWASYKWMDHGIDDWKGVTKYTIADGHRGIVGDGKTILDPKDDAAHIILGDAWRMPTKAEMEALLEQCKWTWITRNGVNGYEVKSKAEGNENGIFLPAAGMYIDSILCDAGSFGYYWSSSLSEYTTIYAVSFGLYSDDTELYEHYRYIGRTIRPVSE